MSRENSLLYNSGETLLQPLHYHCTSQHFENRPTLEASATENVTFFFFFYQGLGKFGDFMIMVNSLQKGDSEKQLGVQIMND